MEAIIIFALIVGLMLAALGGLWWLHGVLTDPRPMAIDLREDDMTLRIKATCKRGGRGYAITEDQEHA